MPRKPRSFTREQLLKLSVTSGISVVLVRFLCDAGTARELGAAIAAAAPQCIRRYEIEPDAVIGHAIRFHLVDNVQPPPDWKVVEECARRAVLLEHIVPGGYHE